MPGPVRAGRPPGVRAGAESRLPRRSAVDARHEDLMELQASDESEFGFNRSPIVL